MIDTAAVKHCKEADYKAALKEIENLMTADRGTPEGERLDVLVTLVEAYEASIEINKEDFTMSDNTYNGWTNYETWQAALWLNEEDFLGRCQEDEVKAIDSEMQNAKLNYITNADEMRNIKCNKYNG